MAKAGRRSTATCARAAWRWPRATRSTAGQQLGLVGMSGEANFPHVHLTVRRAGASIDPFTGGPGGEGCGEPGTPLWAPALLGRLAHDEVPIAVVGLADHLPDRDAIVAGTARAEAAVHRRAGAGRLRPGLRPARGATGWRSPILGPDGGQVSEAGFDLDEAAPRATRAAGRRRPAAGWAPGTYRVEARVRRGERIFARTRRLHGRSVEPAAIRHRPLDGHQHDLAGSVGKAQDQHLRHALAICRGGKLTTAATCRPTRSSAR